MQIEEMKKIVIHKIETINDSDLMEHIYEVINAELASEKEYTLSNAQLNRLQEAKVQYQKGEYKSQEDLEKEINTWLEEE